MQPPLRGVAARADEDHVIADRARAPEAERGPGAEPPPGDDPVEQQLRVVEEAPRRFADLRIGQDLGEGPAQLPRGEEGRPVDVRQERLDGEVVEVVDSERSGPGDVRLRPVELGPAAPRLGQRQQRAQALARGEVLARATEYDIGLWLR
jgi:hypothetical protein